MRLDPGPRPAIGVTLASWSGFENGSGANSVAYTMLKMAVFGPMPRASATTAAAESQGVALSPRTAVLRSSHSISMCPGNGRGCKCVATRNRDDAHHFRGPLSLMVFDFGTHTSALEQDLPRTRSVLA